MRRRRGLVIAFFAATVLSAPASAQLGDIFPWLTPQQEKPAPRRSYVKLPNPAPLPPVRPERAGDAAATKIPQVPAAAVKVPETMTEGLEQEIEAAPEEPAEETAQTPEEPAEEEPEEAARKQEDQPEGGPEKEPEMAAGEPPQAKTAAVPLPPERPEREDEDEPDIAEKGEIDPGFPEVSREATCRLRLKARGVRFEEIAPVVTGKVCGIPSAIRLTALSPSDRLTQPAVLNCRTAEALTDWYFKVVGPAARRHFDATPTGLRVAASYVCRNRNGSSDGPISEHAFGNAVDISAILFRDRKTIEVSRPRRGWKDGFFVREINAGACAMFATVIGPEGDAAHRDHFHFDMKKRTRDYKLCQ